MLVDPAPEAGRGTAYATPDPRHRLNVPAGGMSCYPDDPGHFTRWLCRHGEPAVSATDFATRYRYGAYLADSLAQAVVRSHGTVSVRRLRTRAEGCTGALEGPAGRPGQAGPAGLADPAGPVELHLADGGLLTADSAVLATGPAAPTAAWAPPALRTSPRFINSPWKPGVLDAIREDTADILLVGTGLTAVDLALTLDHPGRTVHAVSRNGLLPQPHALGPAGAMEAPSWPRDLTLNALRRTVYRHVSRSVRTHGDWRPALDSLRPHTARLWHSLTSEERGEFLAGEGALWNTHRHRMAPTTAESVTRARTARRLQVHASTITDVAESGGQLIVALANGRTLRVGWVINCTGPGQRLEDPLWRGLFETGTAVPGPLGMGVATRDGRLLDARGRSLRPLFTLGAPRRGELWETTAIPEIRVQAAALAVQLLAPPVRRAARRRPVDGLGLPLSTHAEAANAYRNGLDRVLKVRAGAEDAFARAVALDPGFALGHAALALLGHECGAAVDVPRALADAQRCAHERADERERSFVEVITHRVQSAHGDRALIRHLDTHPADALALAAAVPTIAFSGVTDLDDDYALRLVERTSPAYDGHWFHTSLLAFLRQEQGRLHEAGELAHRALGVEPASAHRLQGAGPLGCGEVGIALEGLQGDPETRERGAEFVARVGGETAGGVHADAQLVQHAVQRVGEVRDLLRACEGGELGPCRVRADRESAGPQAFQWLEDDPGEQPDAAGRGEGGEERDGGDDHAVVREPPFDRVDVLEHFEPFAGGAQRPGQRTPGLPVGVDRAVTVAGRHRQRGARRLAVLRDHLPAGDQPHQTLTPGEQPAVVVVDHQHLRLTAHRRHAAPRLPHRHPRERALSPASRIRYLKDQVPQGPAVSRIGGERQGSLRTTRASPPTEPVSTQVSGARALPAAGFLRAATKSEARVRARPAQGASLDLATKEARR